MREDDDGDTRYQIINGSAAGAEEEAAEEAAVSRSLFLLFFLRNVVSILPSFHPKQGS